MSSTCSKCGKKADIRPHHKTGVCFDCSDKATDWSMDKSKMIDLIDKLKADNARLLEAVKNMFLYISTYGGDVTENFVCGGNGEYYRKLIAQSERI